MLGTTLTSQVDAHGLLQGVRGLCGQVRNQNHEKRQGVGPNIYERLSSRNPTEAMSRVQSSQYSGDSLYGAPCLDEDAEPSTGRWLTA